MNTVQINEVKARIRSLADNGRSKEIMPLLQREYGERVSDIFTDAGYWSISHLVSELVADLQDEAGGLASDGSNVRPILNFAKVIQAVKIDGSPYWDTNVPFHDLAPIKTADWLAMVDYLNEE